MPKRITQSQIRSQFRNAESKARRQLKQEVNKAQRKLEQDVKRAVGKSERAITNRNKRAVAKLNNELRRLNSQSKPTRHTVLWRSNLTVQQSYQRLEQRWQGLEPDSEAARILDIAYQDVAESTAALNALEENETDEVDEEDLKLTEVTGLLESYGLGLERSWRGALHALSPANDEAARHFCTSAREIFTTIFEARAPDKEVLAWDENCQKTERGTPTRRAKLKFMLARKRLAGAELEDFVEDAIEDVLKLWGVFNPATHGAAGAYTLQQLYGLKARSENGIRLLNSVAI